MTQTQNVIAYKEGNLMSNHGTEAFYFMGKMWSTKKNKRGKKYSFDSGTWKSKNVSLLYKGYLVLTGKYKKLYNCPKSRKVGV